MTTTHLLAFDDPTRTNIFADKSGPACGDPNGSNTSSNRAMVTCAACLRGTRYDAFGWEPFDKAKHMDGHALKRGLVLRFTEEYPDKDRRGECVLIGDVNCNGGACDHCAEVDTFVLSGEKRRGMSDEDVAAEVRGIEVFVLELPDVAWAD